MTQPAGFFDRALEAADRLADLDLAGIDLTFRARLRAQEHGEGPETPAKPSEALLAAARAVLAASVDVPESILTGGREIPLSVVAGYTPEQLAEAGIV